MLFNVFFFFFFFFGRMCLFTFSILQGRISKKKRQKLRRSLLQYSVRYGAVFRVNYQHVDGDQRLKQLRVAELETSHHHGRRQRPQTPHPSKRLGLPWVMRSDNLELWPHKYSEMHVNIMIVIL